ncbi:MAG: ATP-binding protein [Myxococcales bacterium]|nr:ATP-binding protein [Myxococcales bacterium]
MVLHNKIQIPEVSGRKRVRVLIASGDPERIMLVRESLQAWPEAVVCRVAVSREDAIAQAEVDLPQLVCWDTCLGADLPDAIRGICTLLLGQESCTMPAEHSSDPALPEAYVAGLERSINREYELRRLSDEQRHPHGNEPHGRLLLLRAAAGIVVVDHARQVLFANPAAGALLGVDADRLVGKPFPHSVPEAGRPESFRVKLPDGLTSPLSATSLASIWDGREATVIQLEPAHRPSAPPSSPSSPLGPPVSEDRLRMVGRLAAGLAHEVNNPLTFVLANLESLRESHQALRRFFRSVRLELATQEAITPQSFDRLTAEAGLQEVIDDAADMLTDCYKGMHRIQDIARSLGMFSRPDDHQAVMIDISRVIDDACAMVFNQIRYRARLVKRFEPIPLIAAFPGRIAHALVNMLTNAAEAIDGGAYEKHRIVVSTRLQGDHIIVAVSDTGSGIDEDHRERIFTPGFTTKAHEGGMGMGLAACIRVAEQHGGRLEVHHLQDRGTRFELILPVETGLAAVEPRRESRPTSEAPAKRSRLLIVDDDAMVLSALRRRLRRRYDIVTVLGGAEALAVLSDDPGFDSVVCDLMMPEVDGKSFYDALKADHPRLADRIVFMSGGAFTPRLRKFAASVPNPVLQKPVSREDLESMLSAHDDDGD